MSNSTTRLTLTQWVGTDSPSAIRTGNVTNTNTLDNAVLVTEGLLGSRPGAGTVEKDHIYKATDTGQWFISDGSNWFALLVGGTWTALTSTFGQSGGYAPSLRIVGDKVELSGIFSSGAGLANNGTLATFASSFSPAQEVDLNAGFQTSGNTTSTVVLRIVGGDTHIVIGASAMPSGGRLFLDGLWYRLS